MVVAHLVSELAQDHGDFDGLAVLVAGVVVERVRQRAEAEDAIARLDVVERSPRPRRRPLRQHPVASPLERSVVREVAACKVRVESLVDRHLHELVQYVQVVLSVGVDREHEVVGVELADPQTFPQLAQRRVVRLRHSLVDLVHEQAAARVRCTAPHVPSPGDPALDLEARVVGGPVVDDNELVDERIELVEDGCDRRLLVVRRDHRDAARRSCHVFLRPRCLLLAVPRERLP
jgi:hypothetical protein